ncbi:DUF2345 domain-containing protein, partial [Enterobacteriaceae bacterium RIT691]|nr:DUF2345 domain-containing protein [Enterobacteriaceae bacterium RIT691]
GIFISADAQPKAGGQILEMQPAISLLESAQQQMQKISADAQTAEASPADIQSQINLLQQSMTELKQAVLLMSAPKGIALVSGEHLQVSAKKNLIASAGNKADISVVKDFFIGVGNTFSLFVRKMGIKLIANQGAVSLQAQNDVMELLAQKAITITSTQDEITITAKKKITINGGGSYITLDGNKIECGTKGEFLTKAGIYGRKPQAFSKPEMMAFPLINSEDDEKKEFDEQFQIFDDSGMYVLGNIPYKITSLSGLVWEGITDDDGFTQRVETKESELLSISYTFK